MNKVIRYIVRSPMGYWIDGPQMWHNCKCEAKTYESEESVTQDANLVSKMATDDRYDIETIIMTNGR